MASDLEDTAVASVLSIIVVTSLAWFFGIVATPTQLSVLLFALIVFGFAAKQTIDISVGFALITAAIVMVVLSVTPGWISEPLASFSTAVLSFFGIGVGYIDPVSFAVLAVALTAVMLIARYRITGKKDSLRHATNLTLKTFQKYIREYMTIGRLVILTGFTAVVIALQQTSQVLGSVGDVIASAPFVASNIVTAAIGYLSLGGDLPYLDGIPLLSTLSAGEFGVLVLLIIGLAAAADYRGRGPVSQFLRNRGL